MIVTDYEAIAEAMKRIQLEERPFPDSYYQITFEDLEEMTEEDIERARMLDDIVWY